MGTLNNSWGYKYFDNDWKSPKELLFWIVEIASKGGNYMLNVGPTADGIIPPESVASLSAVGKWMQTNGEAVYGTTRWDVTREGPTTLAMEGTSEREKEGFSAQFTAQDIWYTRKGKTIYAIALVAPADGKVLLKTLANGSKAGSTEVRNVRLLGSDDRLKWERSADGLEVSFPNGRHSQYGYALAIELGGYSLK